MRFGRSTASKSCFFLLRPTWYLAALRVLMIVITFSAAVVGWSGSGSPSPSAAPAFGDSGSSTAIGRSFFSTFSKWNSSGLSLPESPKAGAADGEGEPDPDQPTTAALNVMTIINTRKAARYHVGRRRKKHDLDAVLRPKRIKFFLESP